jgi:predicted kinase
MAGHRLVFFTGLPGTGKSLMVHQVAHLAVEAGRRAHRLQWDVARPVFEASRAGRRYPLVDGVTHAVIRKAAGLWAREAIAAWNDRYPGPEHLLIGETPFVGGRFVELARVIDDPAETLLAAPSCRFALPVPSTQVRQFLEAQRERRAASPLHPREREDAPPAVLRSLWRELQEVGRQLGLVIAEADYDPLVYRRVFEAVLRHRHVDVVALDVILPTATVSVYDFAVSAPDLTPTESEAEAFVENVERRYADPTVLEDELEHWWQV